MLITGGTALRITAAVVAMASCTTTTTLAFVPTRGGRTVGLGIPSQGVSSWRSKSANHGVARSAGVDGKTSEEDTTAATTTTVQDLKAEAEALRAKADRLRMEIQANEPSKQETNDSVDAAAVDGSGDTAAVAAATTTTIVSPWAVDTQEPLSEGDREYRLYVDIGREEGTWMDPRWGASGNRIEFTLDVVLRAQTPAPPERAQKLVKDNSMGRSSPPYALEPARYARLREGFDKMKCTGGAYRIDSSKNGRQTLRMVLEAEGTERADQAYVYGDVSVPKGCLYFSLPCFGRPGIDNLSIKEGVVSVRQMGWHTGWRREESRILGVFRAKPLKEAQKKDSY